MRTAKALPAAALLLVAADAAAQSSGISGQDSSSIEADRRNREWVQGALEERKEASVRESIEAGDWASALDGIRQGLVDSEDPARRGRLHLLEARIRVQTGEPEAAMRTYRSLLRDPAVADEARSELHGLYVRRGDFEGAERLLPPEGASGQVPRSDLMRAFAHSTEGRYGEAARLAGRAAERGDPEALVLRANALLALGSHEEAEPLYLRVLREESSRKVRQVAHFGLGQVARVRGARALRALQDERAVRLGPAPWAELDLGLALQALGRREEARARLVDVASAHPELASTARLALARLDEEEGRVGDGVEKLAAALEGGTGDFLVLTRLAELLLQEGREERGIEAHRAALTLFPDFPNGRALLTRALTSRGRWDEVPAPSPDAARWELPGWTWDRLLGGELPLSPVVGDRDEIPLEDPRRFVLALVHLRAGNAGAALGWTDGAGPVHGVLASLRAEALEKAGRAEEARALWEAILATGEGGPVGRERLAALVFDSDPERADELWHSVFTRYPEFPRARIRRARILEDAGRLEDALEGFREAKDAGWFSPREQRRIRAAIEDLEELLLEREEARLEVEG